MVRTIEFRGPAPDETGYLRTLLAQKENEPLDKQKLRRSIHNLYETGRFDNIQIEAERTGQQEVTLVFVAEPNFFIGSLSLSGAPRKGLTSHQLLNAAKLPLGELYTDAKRDEAIRLIKRALEADGYYRAEVTVETVPHPESSQMELRFHLTPGEQAAVGAVTIRVADQKTCGVPGLEPNELMLIGKIHSGDAASKERANRALQRIRKRYQKQDRMTAQVAIASRTYDPKNNTVDYAFGICRGPRVEVELRGASMRQSTLKKYIPIYEENALDDDLLAEGARNLRDFFQSRGYFDVAVTKEADLAADPVRVVYTVGRGARHKLVAVDVDWKDVTARADGKPYFAADAIREHMQVQPAGRLFLQGLYSQSLLARDRESIVNLYKANGFPEVNVETEVEDNYQGSEDRIRVLVHVSEGPQTRVNTLRIVGNTHIPEDELRGLINTTEGQPFSDFNISGDREAVMNLYFNRGFPEVGFEPSSTPLPGDPARQDLVYQITEGRQVFVDRVLITGLHYTKPFVVAREMQIHDEDPLSQSAILDSQRKLYDLGIFNEVDVAVQNPEGNDTRKDVLFDVKEARRWTFNYGFGFEVQTGSEPNNNLPQGRTGWSPRVSFDLTRINFRGRNHTVLFKSHLGRLEQRGLFTYQAPRWFDRENLKFSFITFYDNANDIRTFTSQRLEGAFQVEHRWSRATTLLYRFSYRRVKASNIIIDPNSPLIPLYSKPARIGMPTFTYIRDTRDNPLDSRRGNYTTVDLGVSSKYFGSQASFSRLLFQNSTYHPFRKGTVVLARSTRFGIENPIAYRGSPQAVIPLPELLFAGGGNSHRGFSINQAGPRDLDTGFPLGGEALFTNNIELRLPPPWLPFFEDKLSPVLFYDYGNAFGAASDLFRSLLKVHQNNPQNCRPKTASDPAGFTPACDFNFMSHAIGGGIRYNTPIGPVRLDFGYNLNPPVFLIGRENRTDTLRHFNFFFSIGQTF